MAVKQYQREGIAFLASRRRALLGDDAGLGKSMQMILAANAIGAQRILILAPAVARGSWKLQLAEWDDTGRPVATFPAHNRSTPDRYTIPASGPLALIVGLEWLSLNNNKARLLDAMAGAAPFDVAFVDEAHAVKNRDAGRTKAVYGARLDLNGAILERTPCRWLATATPTPLGHVGELYTHLRALFPDVLASLFGGKVPNAYAFEDRFCRVYETRFGREVIGNKEEAVSELRDALRPHILMRRKMDVLAELPPILTVPLPLDTGSTPHGLPTDGELAAMSDDEVLSYLARSETEHVNERRLLGTAKREAVRPWIADFLSSDPGRKLLVFAHHREVIEGLRLDLANFNPAVIYGGVTPAQKEAEVRRFQADPSCRVFVGQNIAAGTAITLTAADTVLLLEPHPSPDQNYQIISRAHRLGQRNMVTAVIAYDERVPLERRQAQILRRRARDNEALFGVQTPGVI